MIRLRRHVVAMIVIAFCAATGTARGGVFNDIAIGLDYAGFNFLGPENVNISGRENLLSGGADFLTSVNFNGSVFDMGAVDLTMLGPVSFAVSTSNRFLNTLDISFQTAAGANATATPLNYLLNFDSGNQLGTIEGTLLVDGDLSINGFGFYDLSFTYSSRQNVTRDGRYVDDLATSDLDIGPIHVRGNIFADVFALLTAPFFEATGQSNLFESFSGTAQLKEILDAASSDTAAQLAAGGDAFGGHASATLRLADSAARPGSELVGIARGMGDAAGAGVVPEPTVLLLVLLGLPVVLGRHARRRFLAH